MSEAQHPTGGKPPPPCVPTGPTPHVRRVATVVASIAAAAIAAAASRSLNELAVAGVRAMLGFECRRAVVQEPRARHSAMYLWVYLSTRFF